MLVAVSSVAECVLSSPVLTVCQEFWRFFFLKPNMWQCQIYGEAYINSYETHNERRGNRKAAALV